MKQLIFLLCSALLICSCEGVVGGDGRVISGDDHDPLNGVRIVIYHDDDVYDTTFSDENGYFIGSDFIGCPRRCPTAKLVFEKLGFKSKTIILNEAFRESHGGEEFPKYRDSMVVVLEELDPESGKQPLDTGALF